jgi:predicted extracellular nuclease
VLFRSGVVSRPASGQPDAVVSLSYVITVGTQSTQPVSIEFTVKANEEVVVPVTQDLFFSEYIEGSSNNKAIEIYNPTSTSVDLSQYTISLFTNGATTPTSRTLSGTLNAGDVYVIANSQANAGILAVADLAIAFASGQFGANWNGDDAIGLYKGTTLIDVFGVIGVDPGTSWTVGTGSTVDRTLVRKSSVSTGVTTWNPDQWDVLAVDTVSSLGSHSIS